MEDMKKKVLIVATSRKTQGGISSVVKAHEKCSFWVDYKCRWLETHMDGSLLSKLAKAVTAYCLAILLIPQYSIVHIHLSEPPSALRKMPIFLLSKFYRKKVVVHFHSFSPETTINGKYNKLYTFLFTKADRVIVLSTSWKKWVNEAIPQVKNVEIVYNPCEEVSHILPDEQREDIILYAGALNERKGYRDLITAFHSLASKYPTWILILAGNGQIVEANKYAASLNISDQIKTVGWISGQVKDSLFRKARIFCLPSNAEGFPTAILDACSYGIAFITTPVGGIPDIISDGRQGLLFQPGNITKLTECLDLLMSDKVYRERLSERAWELSQTAFHIDVTDQSIRKIYNELLIE